MLGLIMNNSKTSPLSSVIRHGNCASVSSRDSQRDQEEVMPEKQTLERARKDKRKGKSASTQAGKFVRDEMHHIREGIHGARSTKQAIAIGLSKARRAGVNLPPPRKGTTSERTRKNAERAYRKGRSGAKQKVNPRRSRATTKALQRESTEPASRESLSQQAKQQSRK